MNAFESLLDRTPEESPAETQRRARELFPKLVSERFDRWFYLREPDSPVRSQGLELILGIATYSQHDLRLLDEIVEMQGARTSTSCRIGLFDVLSCETMADVPRFLPSVDVLSSAPALAAYSNGRLADLWEGYWLVAGAVRQLLGVGRVV